MSEAQPYFIYVFHDPTTDERYPVRELHPTLARTRLPENWRHSANIPEPISHPVSDIDLLLADASERTKAADGDRLKHEGAKRFIEKDADRQEAYDRCLAYWDKLVEVQADLIQAGLIDPA